MNPIFCPSLRKRPAWSKVPLALRRADSSWREKTLACHDFAFPVAFDMAAALLVAPHDMARPDASWSERLQKLTLAYGGDVSFVFFVLGDGRQGADYAAAVDAFLRFQVLVVEFPSVTAIPLARIDALPALIAKIQGNFTARLIDEEDDAGLSSFPNVHVLSHCTTGPKLSERHANMLADLTSSLADAAIKFGSASSRAPLSAYIGERDAERVVGFFAQNTLI
ncbi:hypothetical protein BROUX41_000829 [Berkeleyomyces rouxiae]|uniref:uncharacterized protein n=1 Tax=Berkeleyomyces rouxiae TaxID=2035830 RepID=UPI003B7B97E8